jgi:hypothetical protein
VFFIHDGIASLCAETANGNAATATSIAESRMNFLVMILDFPLVFFLG